MTFVATGPLTLQILQKSKGVSECAFDPVPSPAYLEVMVSQSLFRDSHQQFAFQNLAGKGVGGERGKKIGRRRRAWVYCDAIAFESVAGKSVSH